LQFCNGTMESNHKQDAQSAVETRGPHHPIGAAELAAETLAGAAAGAALGVLAGPPGVLAGALIGGAVAAVAGAALHEEIAYESAADAQLDRDIGVFGGDLGEVSSDAPKSKRGAFHATSLGLGGGSQATPSEGPMQNLDDE
jgi:hypothetical protein